MEPKAHDEGDIVWHFNEGLQDHNPWETDRVDACLKIGACESSDHGQFYIGCLPLLEAIKLNHCGGLHPSPQRTLPVHITEDFVGFLRAKTPSSSWFASHNFSA